MNIEIINGLYLMSNDDGSASVFRSYFEAKAFNDMQAIIESEAVNA